MSSLIGPGKALEMAGALRRAVNELTARADKLTEEYRQRIVRERLRQQAALKEYDESVEAELRMVETDFEAQVARAEETFTRRKAWVGKTFQSSNARRLQQIEDYLGGQKYNAQKIMLQAEKDRDAALSAAVSHRKEFFEKLGQKEAALSETEREAQSALAGYQGLQRQFQRV